MQDLQTLIHYCLAENPSGVSGFLESYGKSSFSKQSAVNDCLAVLATHGDGAIEEFMREVHPDAAVFERIYREKDDHSIQYSQRDDWSKHFEYRIHIKHLLAGIALCLLAYFILK